MSPATRPRVLGPRCPTHPTPPLPQEGALPESRSPAQRRPRPASSSGGRGVLRGGEGDPGAVGVPHGPGRPPNFSRTFLRRPRFGESWALSGHVVTCTRRVGVCPCAWDLWPPTLHLIPCAVTSSLGREQTAILQSWKGARPGWGQEASRGTISPLSSI